MSVDGETLAAAMKAKGFSQDSNGDWVKPPKAKVKWSPESAKRVSSVLKKIYPNGPKIKSTFHKKPKIKRPKNSSLETRFDALWLSLGGPPLVREFRFHEVRRWRFDRAHLASKIAIELQGGTYSGGRHTRGKGYESDRQKSLTAQTMGWRVFELTNSMLTAETLKQILFLIPAGFVQGGAGPL